MKKLISILGSTGSVGLATLLIVNKKKNYFKPYIFMADKNFKLICQQIKKYKPSIFIINDQDTFLKVSKKFKRKNIKIVNSFKKIKIIKKSNITISAIPGIAGLLPTLKMTEKSNKILIANKESIICGWDLIRKKARNKKTKIIPIDSEHFSIFTLIKNENINFIKKIILTASGGPFLDFTYNKLKKIKPHEALRHPKWKMGKKITINSSNLMNKIFELVEAQKLFNLPSHKIDIVIHPNSLVHAILELKNGLKKFIYHETSMTIPLANAIFDGDIDIEKIYKNGKSINFENLIFKKVDQRIFPNIKLKNKINKFPSSPIIVNSANEILVDQFLRKKIGFLDINKIIMTILKDINYKKYAIKKPKNLNQINLIDSWARETTLKLIEKKYV